MQLKRNIHLCFCGLLFWEATLSVKNNVFCMMCRLLAVEMKHKAWRYYCISFQRTTVLLMQKSKLWHTLGLHGQEIQEIVWGWCGYFVKIRLVIVFVHRKHHWFSLNLCWDKNVKLWGQRKYHCSQNVRVYFIFMSCCQIRLHVFPNNISQMVILKLKIWN